MTKMEDMANVDLYELLGILCSATTPDIKKAYRKKALKCHPDKNPDNPKAAELFHQLSKALEILTDESARSAYDKVINAKKAAALRNKELDSKRKKLKEDLEARERQAQDNSFKQKSAEQQLLAEILRLRKEGSKQLEEEIELVRRQVQEERFCNSSETADPTLFRLKVNWKISNNDSKDVYNNESLTKIFSKYGDIAALVVSNKKKGSALLEFTSSAAALKAHQLEKGFLSNPLTLSWLSGTPPISTRPSEVRSRPVTEPLSNPTVTARAFPCFPSTPAPDVFTMKRQDKDELDFESMVLSRMRKAEEEKRSALKKETLEEGN